jgi:hypothetical protein
MVVDILTLNFAKEEQDMKLKMDQIPSMSDASMDFKNKFGAFFYFYVFWSMKFGTFFKNLTNNSMTRFICVYNLTPNNTQYYTKVILAILSSNFGVNLLILCSTS